MYHLRLKGSHYEMGVKRGVIFKKNNIVFPLNMDEFQMKHGMESEILLNKFFPEVCDEIKGITDTLKIDYNKFSSWLLAMGCCMYNLDDNAPKEVRGCTAFAVVSNNKIYYGRNNDLPPFLKAGSKSEIYTLNNGRKFNLTTSSFINGEEGVNNSGLVVAMTFVSTNLKNIRPGFNSVFVVRYLLEKASNTFEAERLLLDLPIASNCNILLADKEGNMEVIECTPLIKNIRKPIIINNNLKVVCTVNSFISNDMKQFAWDGDKTYKSNERYDNVINAFRNYKNENMLDYIMDILKGNYGFMCQYKKEENFQTIWSSIIELDSLVINRAEGNPRKCKFIVDKRLNK